MSFVRFVPRLLARKHLTIEPLKPPQSNSRTFLLTRVTRIFQKSVFTEITPAARAGCRAGFFVARTQAAAAQGVFSCENQKRRSSHAVSEGRTRKSGRPATRGAQLGHGPGARFVGGGRGW